MLAEERRHFFGSAGASEVVVVALVRREIDPVFQMKVPSVDCDVVEVIRERPRRLALGREPKRLAMWELVTRDRSAGGCNLRHVFFRPRRIVRLLHRMEKLLVGCLEE
jgi:hypothetical protein